MKIAWDLLLLHAQRVHRQEWGGGGDKSRDRQFFKKPDRSRLDLDMSEGYVRTAVTKNDGLRSSGRNQGRVEGVLH